MMDGLIYITNSDTGRGEKSCMYRYLLLNHSAKSLLISTEDESAYAESKCLEKISIVF